MVPVAINKPLLLLLSLIITIAVIRPLWAGDTTFHDELMAIAQQATIDAAEKYDAVYAELALVDPATWTDQQDYDYLSAALWKVYLGLSYYSQEHGGLPPTLEELAGTKYLAQWPGNPYRGWQPMRVLTAEDGFAPGDMVWLICPPEFYSGVKHPHPYSCELGMYGPTVEFAEQLTPQTVPENTWVVIPAGVFMTLGQYHETTATTRPKFERAELLAKVLSFVRW